MMKHVKSIRVILSILLFSQVSSPVMYSSVDASEFHRVIYKSVSGYFPYINQNLDTKPYGMNGALSSSPAVCIMIAAYYGSLTKRPDDLGPSGYGSYICNPYEIKSYTFSDVSPDPEGKNFAGAYGFLVKEKKSDPLGESTSDFLRAHSVLTTYYKYNGDSKDTLLSTIKKEIQQNRPIYLQYKDHNVVITGYGYSSVQKDLLLINDPAFPSTHSLYLSNIEPSYLLFTKTISYADTVQVICKEIEVREKPSVNSNILSKKMKSSVGTIKLHPEYSDLWINEKVGESLQSWFYIQWEDGSKGWSSPGKGLTCNFEPFIKVKEDPEKNKVTLQLTIHEETISGPLITGVKVTAIDGNEKTYVQTTNNFGYVTLTGEKGKWSFKLTKQDFYDKNWKENIEQTQEKHVFILKKSKKEEDLKKPNLICKEIRLSGGMAEEDKMFFINPVVQNVGKSAVTSRSHVKVFLSPKNDANIADDIFLGEAEVSILKIDEICIATVFFHLFPSIPLNRGKEYEMWPVIIIDSQNEVDESDENNTYKANLPIIIKRKPREGDKSPCSCPPKDRPSLRSPVNDTIDGKRITFTWGSVQCASFYDIAIYDSDTNRVFSDGPITGLAYTLEIPLDPGQMYYWCIIPGNQIDWGPPSHKATFYTK